MSDYICKGCGRKLDRFHNFLPYCGNDCIDRYRQKIAKQTKKTIGG